MKTCFLIPCFNEEDSIDNLFHEFIGLWLNEKAKLIFVDDGSSDGTIEKIKINAYKFQIAVEIVSLSRNFGKEKALQAGISTVSIKDRLVVIDADGQHTPSAVSKLIQELKQSNVDIVFGVRKDRNYQPFIAQFSSSLVYKLLNFCKTNYSISSKRGDFFACNPNVTQALKRYKAVRPFWKGYYAYMGFKSKDVDIDIAKRLKGNSKFNLWALTELALDGLTSYTTWLLRAFFFTGTFTGIISFTIGLLILMKYIATGATASGFYTQVLLIMFFGSLNLIAISVVGEFLKSTIMRSNGLPNFIIKNHEIIFKQDS